MSASLFLALSCTSTTPDEAMSLPVALEAAEAQYGVPRDLLAALAYGETRFNPHLEDTETHLGGHPDARFGVMGLTGEDSLTGPTLDGAAACIGREPAALIHDPGLNVLGAACLLDQASRELGEGELTREADWAEVVGWFSGSDDGSGQASYVRQVYRLLESGFSVRTPAGDWIEVEPRDVDLWALAVNLGDKDASLAKFLAETISSLHKSGTLLKLAKPHGLGANPFLNEQAKM